VCFLFLVCFLSSLVWFFLWIPEEVLTLLFLLHIENGDFSILMKDICWTAMILGYVKGGQGCEALELFRQMQQKGVQPDSVAFVGVLNACASVGALEEGRHGHEQIIQSGCDSDVVVESSLVDMYAKCGSMEEAWKVFSKMSSRDVVSWTAMILR
jgi:pentatricopeptide repeat protein